MAVSETCDCDVQALAIVGRSVALISAKFRLLGSVHGRNCTHTGTYRLSFRVGDVRSTHHCGAVVIGGEESGD
jgi:hypothetical protein